MRTTRNWSEASRQKLSASTKGKPKTEQTKERIRQSMIRYWQTIPNEQIPVKPIRTSPQPHKKQPQGKIPIEVLRKSVEGNSKSIPVGKVRVREPQSIPTEPRVENEHGIWEEITRDLLTYQGEDYAQKAYNKSDSNEQEC